jgi:CBS domain-containing protein
VAITTTVRNAVSLMLDAGSTELLVIDDDGAPVGVVTLDGAEALLRT